ncbi:MAG: hypothetical protein R3C53_04615 [Pirellulaceae bacterium]
MDARLSQRCCYLYLSILMCAGTNSSPVAFGQIQVIVPTNVGPSESLNREATVPAKFAAFPGPPQQHAKLVHNEIATPEMVQWLTRMIRDNLPETHEDTRKWDKQKEVWDGVDIWREGLRIETKRKKKMVNSGIWTRYAIEIVDPDQNLHIEFHRIEPLADGKIAFAVTVDCALDVFGRLSNWVRDVQLISISANADAACRLTLEGSVQFQMNLLKLPPDIKIKPHIDYAHIDLTYYRVRRISQIGGDFAKVLGNGLRKTVDDKLDDLNAKLVDKINQQLEKHSDRLSFSTQDWLKSKLPLPAPSQAQ